MSDSPIIEPMSPSDWDAVHTIILEGIETGHASFETAAPSWDAWDEQHLRHCRLVARLHDEVVGWAALSPVSDRCAYGGVAEASVYVAGRARRRGVGARLLGALLIDSEREDIWTVQAQIFPENDASLALFERKGFRVVGTRERLGEMNGRWRDVILLERRSRVTGR